MKLLLVGAFFAAISATVYGESNKVKILHNGHLIEVSDYAKQEHLNHGDEQMILYNGHWIPMSIYEAFLEQIESTKTASSLAELDRKYILDEWDGYEETNHTIHSSDE